MPDFAMMKRTKSNDVSQASADCRLRSHFFFTRENEQKEVADITNRSLRRSRVDTVALIIELNMIIEGYRRSHQECYETDNVREMRLTRTSEIPHSFHIAIVVFTHKRSLQYRLLFLSVAAPRDGSFSLFIIKRLGTGAIKSSAGRHCNRSQPKE